eukprot:9021819-Pyramimonas_sp.AAC.1
MVCRNSPAPLYPIGMELLYHPVHQHSPRRMFVAPGTRFGGSELFRAFFAMFAATELASVLDTYHDGHPDRTVL